MDSQPEQMPPQQNQPQQQDPNDDQQPNQHTKSKYQRNQLPKQFNKAKRTLTKLINQYFFNIKQQLLTKTGSKFIYAKQHIESVENAISKLATIRYTDLNTLVPKKSQIAEDFLLSYVAESKKIIKYNMNIHNANNQKPKQVMLMGQQGFVLPDSATPAAFGANAYFFDGSKFDFSRMVYTPIQANYKVNLITGQVSKLQHQPQFYRMKCCIIKVKRGFFIIGGYAGQYKSITKRCLFYSIQNQTFHQLSPVNLIHNCPSGCVHGQKIYIFSSIGIEYFDQKSNQWLNVEIPKRLKCLSFQYCISVSDTQIMIFGGKVHNHASADLKIYNTQTQTVDVYNDILPIGVFSQRSWGPIVLNNFVTVMSNIQASVYPQVMIKRDAVQMVLIGLGGSFLNTIVTS